MKMILATMLFTVSSAVSYAGSIAADSKNEIQHLFDYLKASECAFSRNGDWFEPDKAADHLNNKYDYLLKKNRIASAEDFIELAASKSSMTGTPYLVKCADGKPEDSATWFKAELARFRHVNKP